MFHVEHSEVGLIGATEFVPRGTTGDWLVLNLAVTIRGNVPRETWGLLQDYCSA